MKKLFVLAGTTIGSSLGAKVGLMTAFMVSIVGTGFGMYYGAQAAKNYD